MLLLAVLPDPAAPGRAADAGAGARVATAHSSVELLSDRGSVAPGERFHLAVRHRLAPGWHTYWVNPGDSGMAPEFRWKLPDGMEVGPPLWPVPSRQPFGPLTNYGFGGEVVFDVGDDNLCTAPCEQTGCFRAESGGSAGDEGHFA